MDKPPFPFKNPVEGYLRLTADGRWLYKDEPITHPGLVRILETNYGPGPEGRFEVKLGPQRVVVVPDDTPYFIRDVDVKKKRIWVTVSDGTPESLEPGHIRLGAEGHAYARLSSGHEARFLRKAELRLAPYLDEQNGKIGLRLGGKWTPIEPREGGRV